MAPAVVGATPTAPAPFAVQRPLPADPCHPEQDLVTQAPRQAVPEALDRLRLVAGGLERGNQLEVGHGFNLADGPPDTARAFYLGRAARRRHALGPVR